MSLTFHFNFLLCWNESSFFNSEADYLRNFIPLCRDKKCCACRLIARLYGVFQGRIKLEMPCLLYINLNNSKITLPFHHSTKIFFTCCRSYVSLCKNNVFQLQTRRTSFKRSKHAHKHPFWSALPGWCN